MNTFNLISPGNSVIRFKSMLFPDGQPHVKIDMASVAGLDRAAPVKIITRIANSNDLLQLLFVKNALDYLEFERIEVSISYLMTARMDRVMLDGEPFSLKVVAQLLNQAQFRKLSVFDPHSEVTTALVDRCYAITNHEFVKKVLNQYFESHEKTDFCLVSPDAGALKKIHKLAQYLGITNVVECMKERDLKTGALTNFKTTVTDLSGQTCFIVDDICDGGGTFAGTAQLLKDKGAAKVVLIVSHGIFSKGSHINSVDEIFTTDSYRKIDGVNCFPVEKFL